MLQEIEFKKVPTIPKWILEQEKFQALTSFLEGKDIVPYIKECNSCSARKEARSPVPPLGEGRQIVMCGMNPGEQEDLQGVPFFQKAPAGIKLDQWISVLGKTRDDCVLTNAIHCHTKGNRKPFLEEIETCRGWKCVEFSKWEQAKYIFLLGSDALRSCFGESISITRCFGDILYYWHGERTRIYYFFLLYHPAFVLRNPDLDRQTVEVLKIARQIIDEGVECYGNNTSITEMD